ncbi:hypothetical protein N9W89_07710 [Hellea sp.]|nr:hypothetical protein [Hellea sp.]
MSHSSNTPRLSKVAIVVFNKPIAKPSVITFQYNPETLTRDLKANAVEGGATSDAFRLSGAPVETIKMDCVFDATDDLAENDKMALKHGVRPQLAALETLISPNSLTVIANTALLSLGTLEILPASAPFTVLVLGSRVLPVRMTGFSISEEFFDENLNPIRAKVGLDMTVLTYSDLETSHPGYAMYLSHQIIKETQAAKVRNEDTLALSQKLSAF